MTAFDESGWREHNEWSGPPPTPSEIWGHFNAPGVSAWLRGRLLMHLGRCEALQAGLVQYMHAEGVDAGALLERARATLGRRIRPSTLQRLLAAEVDKAAWKVAFSNLVSGRFTELVFQDAYTDRLATVGVRLDEEVAERSFLDFRLTAIDEAEDFALSINVKNAGRQMRLARQFFGLEPEDTLPMATYKAFGSAAAPIPPLLYAFLVDWTLLERLRETYWLKALTEDERTVFRLLTSFKGFSRDLEDDLITATVDQRFDELRRGVGFGTGVEPPFHAVSAARCHAIFYEQHERSPYVYVKRMNTDPNVHISVAEETVPFGKLIDDHLSTPLQRAALLEGVRRTRPMLIPDPPL